MSRARHAPGQPASGRPATGFFSQPVTAPAPAPGTGRDERTDRFLALSVLLTGYNRIELCGTGLVGTYLRTIDEVLPTGMLDDLLDTFSQRSARVPAPAAPPASIPVPAQAGPPAPAPAPAGGDLAAVQWILDDRRLGPVARNLILLWYCGTWTALPDEWHAAYGSPAPDTTHVVSAEAYQGGLQWVAAGAHPAGARQQGFGSWSAPPRGIPG